MKRKNLWALFAVLTLSVAAQTHWIRFRNTDHADVALDEAIRTTARDFGDESAGMYKKGFDLQRAIVLEGGASSKIPIDAYRGERVAFYASGAPPGATNDLIAGHGIYLRIVNRHKKDLTPRAVWYVVFIRGTVLQVLPENKVIVIEVADDDWTTVETG